MALGAILGQTIPEIPEGLVMESGSYVGNGQYGSNNPTVIPYKKIPKFIIVQQDNNDYGGAPCFLFSGRNFTAWVGQDAIGPNASRVTTGISGLHLIWEANQVKFYNTGTTGQGIAAQLNTNGATYYYYIFY